MTTCRLVGKTGAGQSLVVAEATCLGIHPVTGIAGTTFGGNYHSPSQCIITKQIGGTTLDYLDGLDIVQIDIDPAGAFKDRHAIDHHGHTGALSHVDLVLDTTDMDLQGITTLHLGCDTRYALQHILDTFRTIHIDLFPTDNTDAGDLISLALKLVIDSGRLDADNTELFCHQTGVGNWCEHTGNGDTQNGFIQEGTPVFF